MSKRDDSPNNIPRIQQFYYYLFSNFEWVKACDAIKPPSIAATPLNPFKIETAAISHHVERNTPAALHEARLEQDRPHTALGRTARRFKHRHNARRFNLSQLHPSNFQTSKLLHDTTITAEIPVWLVPHALALSLFDIICICVWFNEHGYC